MKAIMRGGLLLAAWVLLAASAQAQERSLRLNEGRLWDYAQSLFKQGEYYRAISEYWRLLHFFPQGRYGATARLQIGRALLWGGEPALSLRHLAQASQAPGMEAHRDTVHFLRALSYLELKREQPYPARKARIQQALTELRGISPRWPGQKRLKGFLQAMNSPPPLPQKSPLLAGTLSAILPGTGSLYVGRPGEGALAFFTTALFGAAALQAFEQEQAGAGLLLGALGLTFYGGSVLAAVNGTHKFNDRGHSAYLETQRQRFGIIIDKRGLSGVFRKSY